eukprot:COSAG05_NODE_19846_length_287_cov_0.547872_1_plen_66_part_01
MCWWWASGTSECLRPVKRDTERQERVSLSLSLCLSRFSISPALCLGVWCLIWCETDGLLGSGTMCD